MKRIPYGVSNFEKLRTENYFFLDKTKFIEIIEQSGSQYLFFLRPRKFGKSLLISMLEYYYDLTHKKEFDELFSGTYIYEHPTPLRNSYAVLSFDFSAVQPRESIKATEKAFDDYVRSVLGAFSQKYRLERIFTEQKLENYTAVSLINLVAEITEYRVYLLIDEYDNFMNNILVDFGEQTYMEITHGTGFFRSFFAAIKSLTQSGTIDRIFITGVTPLVMNDVTSGFNIGKNISLRPEFSNMVGVTEQELEQVLEYFIKDKQEQETISELVKQWYNGYTFDTQRPDERLYNTTMLWNFLDNYFAYGKAPDDLTDPNIKTDFNKLRFLISVDNKLNGNFSILKEIIENRETSGRLKEAFSIGERIDEIEFVSLLYYLGLLTIKAYYGEFAIFRIPNRTIERLLWEYITQAIENSFHQLRINERYLVNSFFKMSYEGEWKAAIEYILDKFYEAISIRDFVFHEEGIKTFMLAYLNLSPFFYARSEVEFHGGFADIYLEPILTSVKYRYLIELKYIKSSELKRVDREKLIRETVERARAQLQRYAGESSQPLKLLVVVASSQEYVYLDQVETE